MNEHMQRIDAMLLGVWLIDPSQVDVKKFIEASRVPNSVLLTHSVDAVRYLCNPNEEALGCVAGFISEDE